MIDRIVSNLERLNSDELDVVHMITCRLADGVDVYGHLSIDNDRRDFVLETLDEQTDAILYNCMELIRLRRADK
jgi:hypothetical protein